MSARVCRPAHWIVPSMFVAVLAVAACTVSGQAPSQSALPDRLTDREFWQLIEKFSEPTGTFHSENYISNEGRYQTVIPELLSRVKPGGLYLGVGPEQNFTYITALRPRMAFIVDIRRGNLREHLFYKALMELSADRAAFLSRLFGRPRPADLGPSASVDELFAALLAAPRSETIFRDTSRAVIDLLTNKHGFALNAEDITEIEFIYRTGFFIDGPSMMYQRTDSRTAGRRPTYAELMTSDDGSGTQRSYLADEASFLFLKNLQTRNLVVPVVGDFGGLKALPAVAAYARQRRATVSAFYLSNVEQYLRRDGKYPTFCATVASMPLDASSTFIRSQSAGSSFFSMLGAMQAEALTCSVGR